MNYVLLGKFQTDELEHRFGKYRQVAGGQYDISIRQLYESEKKLRIQSLLTLKSRNYGSIYIKQFYEAACSAEDTEEIFSFDHNITVLESDIDKVRDEMPVVTYLAGYCCYITLRKIQCNLCKQNLVFDHELAVEDNYVLIENLSRGKLFFPQDFVVQIVLCSYIIFNKIIFEFEDDFLSIHNKRQFLSQYILKFILESGRLPSSFIRECTLHEKKTIFNIIITCTTNTLLKNYCRKNNNRLSKNSNGRKLKTLTGK